MGLSFSSQLHGDMQDMLMTLARNFVPAETQEQEVDYEEDDTLHLGADQAPTRVRLSSDDLCSRAVRVSWAALAYTGRHYLGWDVEQGHPVCTQMEDAEDGNDGHMLSWPFLVRVMVAHMPPDGRGVGGKGGGEEGEDEEAKKAAEAEKAAEEYAARVRPSHRWEAAFRINQGLADCFKAAHAAELQRATAEARKESRRSGESPEDELSPPAALDIMHRVVHEASRVLLEQFLIRAASELQAHAVVCSVHVRPAVLLTAALVEHMKQGLCKMGVRRLVRMTASLLGPVNAHAGAALARITLMPSMSISLAPPDMSTSTATFEDMESHLHATLTGPLTQAFLERHQAYTLGLASARAIAVMIWLQAESRGVPTQ